MSFCCEIPTDFYKVNLRITSVLLVIFQDLKMSEVWWCIHTFKKKRGGIYSIKYNTSDFWGMFFCTSLSSLTERLFILFIIFFCTSYSFTVMKNVIGREINLVIIQTVAIKKKKYIHKHTDKKISVRLIMFAQTISSLVSSVHIHSSLCCVSAGLLCGSVHRKGPDSHGSGTAHLTLTLIQSHFNLF